PHGAAVGISYSCGGAIHTKGNGGGRRILLGDQPQHGCATWGGELLEARLGATCPISRGTRSTFLSRLSLFRSLGSRLWVAENQARRTRYSLEWGELVWQRLSCGGEY